MQKNYYESLRREFFNKIEALKNQNYFEFYKHSPAFLIALNLAYFVLAEEKLITVDKNNTDILSRYRLNTLPDFIDKIFEGKSFDQVIPDISKKENNGDNLWFLSALRNAILHGGIEDINLEDMTVKINANHNLNQLNANIPVKFFSDFIDKFIKAKQTDNTKIDIPLIDHYFGYKFQLKVSNLNGINDPDLIKDNIEQIYNEIINSYAGYDEGNGLSNQNYEEMIQKISHISAVRNSKKYFNAVKDIIKEQVIKTVQERYPDYNISISPISHKMSAKDIRYKETLSYADYLSQIEDVYKNYTENSKIISEVMSFMNSKDTKKVSPRIIQRKIHEIREQNGEQFTYDKLLEDNLELNPNYLFDFAKFNNMDTELARKISKDVYTARYLSQKEFSAKTIVQQIKAQYSDFYQKYNEASKRRGQISDEDLAIYNKICDVDKISSFFEQANNDRSKMLVGLLYVFGINMYVINKENSFDNLDDIDDYSFMDKLNIEMYSISGMNELDNLNNKKKSLSKNLSLQVKKYKKNSSNPRFPKEKLDEIQAEIDKIKQEIADIENALKTTKTKNFDNKSMAVENNNKRKAAMIRNCLSHNGRIRVIYENNYQRKTAVLLSDYNENGATAFLKCSIDELFKFLRHDAFRDSMNYQLTDESTKSLSIFQVAENALKQGTTQLAVNKAKNIEQQELQSNNTKEGEIKND